MAKNKKTKLVTGLACAIPAVIAVPTLLATVTSCKSNEGTTHIDFSEGTKKKQAVAYFDNTVTYTFLLKDINNPDLVQISLPMLKIDGKEVEDTEKRLMYTAVAKSNGTVILTLNLQRVRDYATSNDRSNTYKNIEVNFNINMKSDELNETVSDMLLTLTVYDYEVTATKETNAHVTKSTDRATYGEDYAFQIDTDSKNFYFKDTERNNNYLKISIAGVQVDYSTWKEWVNQNGEDFKSAIVTIPGDYVLGKIEIEVEAVPCHYEWDVTDVDGIVQFSLDGEDWFTKDEISEKVTPTYLTDIDLKVRVHQESQTEYKYIYEQSITIDGKSPAESSGVVFTRDTLHIPGNMVTGKIVLMAHTYSAVAELDLKCDNDTLTCSEELQEYLDYGVWVPAYGLTGTVKPSRGHHITSFKLYDIESGTVYPESEQYFDLTTNTLNIPGDTEIQSGIRLWFDSPKYTYTGTNSVAAGEQHISAVSPATQTIEYGQSYVVSASWAEGSGQGWEIDPVNSTVSVNGIAVPQTAIVTTANTLTIDANYLMDYHPQGGNIVVSLKSRGIKYNVNSPILSSNITYDGEIGEGKAIHGTPYKFSLTYSDYYQYDESNTTLKSGDTVLDKDTDYTISHTEGTQVWNFVINGDAILGDISVTAYAKVCEYKASGRVAEGTENYLKINNATSFTDVGCAYLSDFTATITSTDAKAYEILVPTVTVAGKTLTKDTDFDWTKVSDTEYTLKVHGDKVKGNIDITANAQLKGYDIEGPDSPYVRSTVIVDKTTGATIVPGTDKVNAVHDYEIAITAEQYSKIKSDEWSVTVGGSTVTVPGVLSEDDTVLTITVDQDYTTHIFNDDVVISVDPEATEYTITEPSHSTVTGLTTYSGSAVGSKMTHYDSYYGVATLDEGYTFLKDGTISDGSWDVVKTGTEESVKSDWEITFKQTSASERTYKIDIPADRVNCDFTIKLTPFKETYKLNVSGLKNVTITQTPTPTWHEALSIPFTATAGTLTTDDVVVKVGDTTLTKSTQYRVENNAIVIDADIIDADVTVTGNTHYSISFDDESSLDENNFPDLPTTYEVGFGGSITSAFTVDSTAANPNYLIDKHVYCNGTELTYNDDYVFQVNGYDDDSECFTGTFTLNNKALNGNIVIKAVTSDTADINSTINYETDQISDVVCKGFYDRVDPYSIKTEFSDYLFETYTLDFDSTCTKVADRAFVLTNTETTSIPTDITSVDFNGSAITEIGANAFKNAKSLTSIDFADSGNTITDIGDGAFAGCTGLTSFTFKEEMETIGSQILSGCTGLTEIDMSCYTDATEISDIFDGTQLSNITPTTTGGVIYIANEGVRSTIANLPGIRDLMSWYQWTLQVVE